MAFELNGFSDAILGQLSQIGVEVFGSEKETAALKAIYTIQNKQAEQQKPPIATNNKTK